MNVEECGRDGTIHEELDETMNPPERTVGLRANVLTLDLPNKRQDAKYSTVTSATLLPTRSVSRV